MHESLCTVHFKKPASLTITKLFLFCILFFFSYSYSFSQKILPDTPVVVIDTIEILSIDTCMVIIPDSIQILKKEIRAEKTKKVFKVLSYLKYTDPGYGKEFSGVEKYKPYKGKKIRSVQIEIFKPFGAVEDDCSQQPVGKRQKFGNKIHFISKEWFVKSDILFKEGDNVDPALFADTEKLLWDRKKFKDIRILIVSDSTSEDVDILVYLQDKLSWVVGLGYSGRLSFGISTYNFFGLPNTLTLFTGINFNKYNLWAFGGSYRYENIRGSQINFITDFLIEKLNRNALLSFYRNFFSIKTQWAFNARYQFDNSTSSLTRDSHDTSSYIKTRSNALSLWAAYSVPVNKIIPCKDDKLKLVFGTKLDHIHYRKRPFISDSTYDRIFVDQQNYVFGIGVARWDYYLARNAFYIDVAEYFPRGYSVSFWAGHQFDEVYGRRTSLNFTINHGMYFKKFGYLYPQLNFRGYIKKKKPQEMVTTLSLDYVSNRINIAKKVFFRQIVKTSTSLGAEVPADRYLNINESNGIRGFSSPVLKGSKTFALRAESDLFYDKKIALTKAMTYIFCDMAWISENGKALFKQSVYQYGIGFGLRLRSADLGVPHLDLQLSFYPRGKDFGQSLVGFSIYGYNQNAVQQNNMFVEPSW